MTEKLNRIRGRKERYVGVESLEKIFGGGT